MANGNLKLTLDAPPEHLDILGQALSGNQSLGDLLAPNPFSSMASAQPQPRMQGLNAPLTLNRYQAMNVAQPPAPQPQQIAPPMRGSFLGRIPKAIEGGLSTAWHAATPVLGKIGEVAGAAFLPNLMPSIPGTRQYNEREENRKLGIDKEQAETDWRRAEAEHLREGEAPAETVEDRLARYDKIVGPGDPQDPRRIEYALTGKITAKAAGEGLPKISSHGPDNKEYYETASGLKPVMLPGEVAPSIQPESFAGPTPVMAPQGQFGTLAPTGASTFQSPIPGGTLPLPGSIAGEQSVAATKPAAEKTPSDVNASIDNYFKMRKWSTDPDSPNYAEHWNEAHKAYTKETKTDPGVVRIEALGDTRGIPVTDTKNGTTAYMNWNDYNRAKRAEPGRYVAPQYDPETQAAITAGRGAAPKNVGTQVQSYGTFVRHAGDLYGAINSLGNTNYPWLNKPINELRTQTGDPRVKEFLAKLDPVRKEFESFLLNNRALYEDDREQASKIIDENTSPAAMLKVLPSLVHTGTIRLEETNEAYKRATGKDFPDLVSPEAQKVFRQMKVEPPRTSGGGGEVSAAGGGGGSPVSDAIKAFRQKQGR